MSGLAVWCSVWSGTAWQGKEFLTVQIWCGTAMLGEAMCGMARIFRTIKAGYGRAWLGQVRLCEVWQGKDFS
jgi:hypothetical protein